MSSVHLKVNYSHKREAVAKAGQDVESALKIVSDIFKGFQDDYLTILEDHEQMKLKLEKLTQEKVCCCKKKPGNFPTEKSFVSDFTIESDSPGIVENTQLETRSKLKLKALDKKKNSCFKIKSPVKIPKSPGKKPKSPRKNVKENRVPELTINRIATQKSQPRTGQLGLSRTDVEISLTPSGKISRQSKLVLSQPKRQILLTNPDNSHRKPDNSSNNNFSKSLINPDDLDFDTTVFEIPFSQEAAEDKITETNFNPFNSRSTPKVDKSQAKQTKKLSQSEIATCITQELNASEVNESDFFSLDNNVDIESQDLDSQFDLLPEETYCETGEALKEKEAEVKNAGSSGVKRKFEAIAGPSTAVNGKLTNEELQELEVVNISDWDTDTSSDKWPTTPLKKRVPVSSFDRIPEKKKSTPTKPFIGEVVRNKAERAKLQGWDCSDCEKYYNKLGLTEKEKAERKNHCSRHRSKFNQRYYTPPGFWDPAFPDTVDSSQEN